MADDIRDDIESSAQSPQSVTVDGRTVVGRSVKEKIDADKYLESRNAVKRSFPGLVFGQISPPGAS